MERQLKSVRNVQWKNKQPITPNIKKEEKKEEEELK